jgi:hypothetical protein
LQSESPVPPRLNFVTLRQDGDLTILRAVPPGPPSGPLVVVFNSLVRKGTTPEFIGTVARSGRPGLFILDHRATWYASRRNAGAIRDAVRAELDHLQGDRLDTLGFSMGAYAAVAFAETLPVRRAVAFSPRFSPDPALVADPRDRPSLRRLSGKFAFPTLEAGMARLEGGLILHGMRGPDRCQFRHIRAPQAVDHWLLPLASHFVALWLQKRGLLDDVVQAALQGDRHIPEAVLKSWGASRKGTLSAGLKLVPFQTYERLKRILPDRGARRFEKDIG